MKVQSYRTRDVSVSFADQDPYRKLDTRYWSHPVKRLGLHETLQADTLIKNTAGSRAEVYKLRCAVVLSDPSELSQRSAFCWSQSSALFVVLFTFVSCWSVLYFCLLVSVTAYCFCVDFFSLCSTYSYFALSLFAGRFLSLYSYFAGRFFFFLYSLVDFFPLVSILISLVDFLYSQVDFVFLYSLVDFFIVYCCCVR